MTPPDVTPELLASVLFLISRRGIVIAVMMVAIVQREGLSSRVVRRRGVRNTVPVEVCVTVVDFVTVRYWRVPSVERS